MKRSFKVLAGLHIEDERTYSKGDIVVSEKELIRLFPQKFQDLGPVEEEPAEEEEAKPQSPPPAKTKRAAKKKAATSPPLRNDDEWE